MKAAIPLLTLIVLSLAGCEDPYSYPGTWHASGVNDANLAVAVANKADLASGQNEPGSNGVLDSAAVTRLYADQAKPLHLEATSTAVGQSGSGN